MIIDDDGNLEDFLESQRPSRNNDNVDDNDKSDDGNHDNNNGDADATLDGVIDDLPPSASIADFVRKVKEIGTVHLFLNKYNDSKIVTILCRLFFFFSFKIDL